MCFSVKIDRKLNRVADRFGAEVDKASFESFIKNSQENPTLYKAPDEEDRVYPNYFAPVIVYENNKKILKPKRYQLLPHFSKESKYRTINPKTKRKKEIPTYNARLDSLEKRNAWSPIFMKNHCLFPFVKFFEWVEYQGKKRQIAFYPEKEGIMWAPGIYDSWVSEDGKETIESFALITTDPRPEVQRTGHDRCPVFLKEDYIDDWLRPENETKEEIYEMLGHQEAGAYQYSWA